MSDSTNTNEYVELEKLYKKKPSAYRRKVLGFIALGYGYLIFTALFIVGLVLGGAYLFGTGKVKLIFLDEFLQFGIPALIIAGLMIRAMFVRIPPPDGTYLEGNLKKEVINFIEPIRQKSNGKKISDVVIVNELNAAVQQRPMFGMIGPGKNYLILGAPLLQLMNGDEVKAVIAHEFGHLSHQHGRMGATVYRLNQTLRNAANVISEKTKSGVRSLPYKFFNWFYPKFNRVTFAMRRGQEYEADEVAAEATHASAIASSLCKLYALDHSLGKYWDTVWNRARTLEDNKILTPHRSMQSEIHGLVNPVLVKNSVDAAMERETDFADSHPCLRDRLTALNVPPITEFPNQTSALQQMFNERTQQEFFSLMDAEWHIASKQHWLDTHKQYKDMERERENLSGKRDSLDAAQIYRLAQIEENLDGVEIALPTYKQLVDQNPDTALAHYHWGRVNIEKNVDLAEAALFKCVELDIELVPDSAQCLQAAYHHANRPEAFEKFGPYIEKYNNLQDQAHEERERISSDDTLVAADFDEETRENLREHLKTEYPEIEELFLVKKEVETYSSNPPHLVGYRIAHYHSNVEINDDTWRDRVTDELSEKFPALNSPFAVIFGKKDHWYERLNAIESALIYTKNISKWKRGYQNFGTVLSVLAVIAVVFFIVMGLITGEWF